MTGMTRPQADKRHSQSITMAVAPGTYYVKPSLVDPAGATPILRHNQPQRPFGRADRFTVTSIGQDHRALSEVLIEFRKCQSCLVSVGARHPPPEAQSRNPQLNRNRSG